MVLLLFFSSANSWGTDPVTQKQGLGFGPQEEFRNCADVRIGGAVPKSVRENPFFAPPDQMLVGSSVLKSSFYYLINIRYS